MAAGDVVEVVGRGEEREYGEPWTDENSSMPFETTVLSRWGGYDAGEGKQVSSGWKEENVPVGKERAHR